MNKLLMAGVLALLPAVVIAQTEGAPIKVEDAYARSANPKSGAVFMKLTNEGQAECTLQGASTPASVRAELHTHREENGMMVMGHADPIIMAPDASHDLSRGGDHVMLMGLVKPLAQGDVIDLELDFGDCGKVQTQVAVDNDRAEGHSGH